MHPRREYVLWIPPGVIMALLGGWRRCDAIHLPHLQYCADFEGNRFALPDDYEIVACTYDWRRQAIGVMLAHPSFPAVADGVEAPSLYYREVTVLGMKTKPQDDPDAAVLVDAAE